MWVKSAEDRCNTLASFLWDITLTVVNKEKNAMPKHTHTHKYTHAKCLRSHLNQV